LTKQGQHLLRLSQELKDELKKLADADNRSLNNYLTTVLEDHVKKVKGMTRDKNQR
jgi:predicted HicB family RNase H-like nuclease